MQKQIVARQVSFLMCDKANKMPHCQNSSINIETEATSIPIKHT